MQMHDRMRTFTLVMRRMDEFGLVIFLMAVMISLDQNDAS